MEVVKNSGKFSKLKMEESEFRNHDRNYDGFCLSCMKLSVGGTEPDARNHECELCGESKVFGMAELLVMNKIEIL